jgi:ABC-type lipoprotein export system ATPase subunit
MSEVLLQLDGVSMHYGKGETAITALAGVDLAVRAGELVAIIGASGSGKSTLLTIAGGLTTPTSGEVVVEGQWLSTMSAAGIAALRRRTLGFVFQDFNLIPALTALENVTLPLELDGWKRRRARSAGLDALRSVELDDRADRYPDDLSGGQQQRVAIARAVVGTRRLSSPTSRPARSTARRARSCSGCCAAASTPAPAASWSPTTRGTPRGPTASCSCATAASSTRATAGTSSTCSRPRRRHGPSEAAP